MMMSNGVLSSLVGRGSEVSASSSSSGSRSNNNNNNNNSINVENGTRSSLLWSQQANQLPLASATQALAPPPKKRGHPDPDAEVIALSPKSLLATNRFICEICNKGFQRDQNLQLHRRGHNLPWKLKQRKHNEVVRKKVYVCPEPTCAHHDPSRALGDLTGIKKHFCRKHGEKKWKCEKCSKRYAVQSDWKAHSKICGTKEYRCDCGTLFSRRDSFTTHRAFCNVLAQESSSKSMLPPKNQLSALSSPLSNLQHLSTSSHNLQPLHAFSIKTEQENLQQYHLEFLLPSTNSLEPSSIRQTNPNPTSFQPSVTTSASPHMSATALLQRAAQMGVTMSNPSPQPSADMLMPHHQTLGSHDHVADTDGLVLSSGGADRWVTGAGHRSCFLLSGLESFRNEVAGSISEGDNAAVISVTTANEVRPPPSGTDDAAKVTGVASMPSNHHLLDRDQIIMMMNPRNDVPSPEAGLHRSYLSSSFNHEAMMNRIMNTLEDDYNHVGNFQDTATEPHALFRRRSDQGMTRDFLGLRATAFSSVHEHLADVGGFELMDSSSPSTYDKNNGNEQPDKDHQYDPSLWQD